MGRIFKKSTGEVSTGSTSPTTINTNKTSYDKNTIGLKTRDVENIEQFRRELGARESNGNYNLKSNQSSAIGKYQFTWTHHGDTIKKLFPNIKTEEDFIKNPEVQEKYLNKKVEEYYSNAKKNLAKARKYHPNISINDLMKINHYQPLAFKKLVNGEIDLNHVPGNKNTTNQTLGYYLYGNDFNGYMRWNSKTQKLETHQDWVNSRKKKK